MPLDPGSLASRFPWRHASASATEGDGLRGNFFSYRSIAD